MKDNKSRYTLRVEQELLDKLGYIAEYEGRTKNRELERLVRQHIEVFEKEHGKIDWIYVNGKERYLNDFVDTLLKVNPGMIERAARLDPTIGVPDQEKKALLEVLDRIRKQKDVTYRFRIKATVQISEEAFHPGHVTVHIPMKGRISSMRSSQLSE